MDQKPFFILNDPKSRQKAKDVLALRVEELADQPVAKKPVNKKPVTKKPAVPVAKKPVAPVAQKGNSKFQEKKHPRGPDGKFAKNKSGKRILPTGLKTLADVAGFKDDLPIKVTEKKEGIVYETVLKNGQVVRVIDESSSAEPSIVQKILSTLAARQQETGVKPPREVRLVRPTDEDYKNAIGFVKPDKKHQAEFEASDFHLQEKDYGKDHQIFINLNWVESPDFTEMYRMRSTQMDADLKAKGIPGWKMNTAEYSNGYNYNLSHEFGHTLTFTGNKLGAAGALYEQVYNDDNTRPYMSGYSKSNQYEAYAEAYAEWALSEGSTTNPVARIYAAHEGWPKAKRPPVKNYGLRKSTPVLLYNENPQNTFAAGDFEITEGVPVIIDYDDGKTPAKHLNMPRVEPTEAERKSAKEAFDFIMNEHK